jgi:hypothetical protein
MSGKRHKRIGMNRPNKKKGTFAAEPAVVNGPGNQPAPEAEPQRESQPEPRVDGARGGPSSTRSMPAATGLGDAEEARPAAGRLVGTRAKSGCHAEAHLRAGNRGVHQVARHSGAGVAVRVRLLLRGGHPSKAAS